MKPDLTVKKFYDALEEGTVLGRKCSDCGNVEWPPVYSCNACGGHHTDWIEMSGEGMLDEFVLAKGPLANMPQFAPYAVGHVTLAEGPRTTATVLGISTENEEELRSRLPVPVKMKIIAMEAGYHRVVFELAE